MQIWENNKKFILLVAGGAAVLLVFMGFTISGLNDARSQAQKNRGSRKDIIRRISTLVEEEGENIGRRDVLGKVELPRVLDAIECREDLPEMGGDLSSAESFLRKEVRKRTLELKKKAQRTFTEIPYPGSSRGSKSTYWSMWKLPTGFTKENIPDLRLRIYATSGIIERAIDAGLTSVSVKRQPSAEESRFKTTNKVLRRTPVSVEVTGPYERVLSFLGRVQQEGFYLQVAEAKITRASSDGQAKGAFTFTALSFVKPLKSTGKIRKSRKTYGRNHDL